MVFTLTCATTAACSSPRPADGGKPRTLHMCSEGSLAGVAATTDAERPCGNRYKLDFCVQRDHRERRRPSQRREYARHARCPALDRADSVKLCRALSGPVDLLERAPSAQRQAGWSFLAAASALVNHLRLRQAAWGPAEDALPLARNCRAGARFAKSRRSRSVRAAADNGFSASLGTHRSKYSSSSRRQSASWWPNFLAGAADDLFVRIAGPTPPGRSAGAVPGRRGRSECATDGRDLQMALTYCYPRTDIYNCLH